MTPQTLTELIFGVLVSSLGAAGLYILNDFREDFKETKESFKDLNAKMGQVCETLVGHDVRIQQLEFLRGK